jgi:Domain of unknown function (DUF4436)
MAEGERATEPSREVPPIADRDGGSSPSAPVVIFSIPALRGLMPGAPPLGVHADLLVLVWVQLAVILGLSLFVITWVSRR